MMELITDRPKTIETICHNLEEAGAIKHEERAEVEAMLSDFNDVCLAFVLVESHQANPVNA